MKTDWKCIFFKIPVPEHLKELVMEVREVYIFDKCKRVYCCELKPSYELTGVHYSITPVYGLTGKKRDEIEAMFIEVPEDCYEHCSYVDSLPKEQFHSYGESEYDEEDTTEREIMEEVRDYYQGNHKF